MFGTIYRKEVHSLLAHIRKCERIEIYINLFHVGLLDGKRSYLLRVRIIYLWEYYWTPVPINLVDRGSFLSLLIIIIIIIHSFIYSYYFHWFIHPVQLLCSIPNSMTLCPSTRIKVSNWLVLVWTIIDLPFFLILLFLFLLLLLFFFFFFFFFARIHCVRIPLQSVWTPGELQERGNIPSSSPR